jgi:hypothetical protein
MHTGTQFTNTIAPNQSVNFFTFNWPTAWDVTWMIVPATVGPAAQINWTVSTQLSSGGVTYWILVKNLSNAAVDIQGRYAVLNG